MSTRIQSFSGIRTIAALMILLGHIFAISTINVNAELGAAGVSIFIMLSGFCMYIAHATDFNHLTRPIKTSIFFSFSHIKKFYLLHIITFCFALFLEFYFLNFHITKEGVVVLFRKSIINLLLLQSYSLDSQNVFAFNGTSWYLSLIIFFYLLTPLIIFIINKLPPKSFFILFILDWLLQILFVFRFRNNMYLNSLTYSFPPYRLGEFVQGCLLGAMFIQKKEKKLQMSYELKSFLEIVTLILFFIILFTRQYISGLLVSGVYYVPFTALLIFVFSHDGGILSKLFSKEIFTFFSSISFELFLVHQLVIRYLWIFVYLKYELPDELFILLSVILSISISYFLHWINSRFILHSPRII